MEEGALEEVSLAEEALERCRSQLFNKSLDTSLRDLLREGKCLPSSRLIRYFES